MTDALSIKARKIAKNVAKSVQEAVDRGDSNEALRIVSALPYYLRQNVWLFVKR